VYHKIVTAEQLQHYTYTLQTWFVSSKYLPKSDKNNNNNNKLEFALYSAWAYVLESGQVPVVRNMTQNFCYTKVCQSKATVPIAWAHCFHLTQKHFTFNCTAAALSVRTITGAGEASILSWNELLCSVCTEVLAFCYQTSCNKCFHLTIFVMFVAVIRML
jgi:hypothetical protein